MRNWPMTNRILVLAAIIFIYLLFPTKTTIHVENSIGEAQVANIEVFWGKLRLYNTVSSQGMVYVPKGKYKLVLKQRGFHDLDKLLKIKADWIPRPNEFTFVLSEKLMYLDKWDFYDPTNALRLDPFITLTGHDVLGRYVDETFTQRDSTTYGDYSVRVHDVNFAKEFEMKGFDLLGESKDIKLKPNEKFFLIDNKDFSYIKNFVTDYLKLSENKFIAKDLRGYPKQYYLASKDKLISFGDMMFLLCQDFTFEENQEEYFLPINKKYTAVTRSINENDCYRHALHGYIPQFVDEKTMSSLLGLKPYFHFDEMLNQKWESGEISLTFDIESGRYVHNENKGQSSINPCDSEITSLGIENEDCSDANRIAWFSPVKNEPRLNIPYPWSSGILGFRTILDLSEKYGVKTTQFLLTKEFEVYDKYDPKLLQDLKNNVDSGLVEIGLHSKYHSHLGTADVGETRDEFIAEKQFLEEEFNTEVKVRGHRAPYLSILQNNQKLHEDTLKEASFDYYTHGLETEGIYLDHIPYTLYYISDRNLGEVHWSNDNFGYVMTIDHPWNLYYEEKEINGEWFLVYNESRADAAKATVYEAISAGFIPVFAGELE